jgi:hypothetical protein
VTPWMFLAAAAVTTTAAVRSTWSPCGLSMLASITPLSEVGRGHRYRTTASWFVVGSVVGGAMLGSAVAALTVGVDALSFTTREAVGVAFGASALATASDIEVRGLQLPVHHRQVNERWLDQFRPWVYGAGFGWQIGTGLATYIMTAAVYLLIVLAALTGAPWLALGLGALFGLVRGLSVFLGRRITTAAMLTAFHRRFYELGPKVRRVTIAVEVVVTALFAWLLTPWALLALAGAAITSLGIWAERRRARAQRAGQSRETRVRVAHSGSE